MDTIVQHHRLELKVREPDAYGFVYLTAVVDVTSRKVLAHRVAITLQEAVARYGSPAVVNKDQGSQFTAQDFVDTVHDSGAKLSLDGKIAWRGNAFVERL